MLNTSKSVFYFFIMNIFFFFYNSTETYNLNNDPSETHPNHKNHEKHIKMTENYLKWVKGLKGPNSPGLGSEGFKNLTSFKLVFISFMTKVNFEPQDFAQFIDWEEI